MLLSSRRNRFENGVYKMQKRVYFVGAQSTGKTTLSSLVATRLRWSYIPEQARVVLSEKGWKLGDFAKDLYKAAEFQRLLIQRQLAEEQKLQGEDFVSDRAFDGIAYAAASTLIASELYNSLDFKEYLGDFQTFGSIVFFVRPHVQLIEQDMVGPDACWESICRIDGMLEYVLEIEKIPYIPLESMSMKSRVRTVEGVLHAAGVPYYGC